MRCVFQNVFGFRWLVLEKNEVLDFVEQMKTSDHVILFYSNPEDKHQVLFTFLKAGLDKGEAAAYVASQETPDKIREGMRSFGINVNELEKSGALRVMHYEDWYFKDGAFDVLKVMELWKNLHDEVMAKGFRGLRVTGEMACFFEKKMVKELVEYERSLHRTVELPMSVICAYDKQVVAKENSGELYMDLIKAHSTTLFSGPEAGIVKTPSDTVATSTLVC